MKVLPAISKSSGRISLKLDAVLLGGDVQVLLTGGDAHIGATALAAPGLKEAALAAPGHYEGNIAMRMARVLARASGRAVAVTAGIHFTAITKAEIAEVEALCAVMAAELAALLGRNANPNSGCAGKAAEMLNINQLEEMENYIRSGKLEEDFKNSGETERHYLLELLEKLMDVADLADEAATRLIFRGLPPFGQAGKNQG